MSDVDMNQAWNEAAWFRGGSLSARDTVRLFNAVFSSPEGKRAMLELMRRWHFFDPMLINERAVERRRCIMELLILCGMWHPAGAEDIAGASMQAVDADWIDRFIDSITNIRVTPKKE